MFSAQAQEGKLATAAEAIFTEMERIRRHGFTPSEFERAQNDLLRSAERKYTNRNDRKNGEYVDIYIDNFRENTAMPDAETEWQIDSMLIKQIPLEIVNQICSQLVSLDKNLVVVINAPEKEGLVNPSEADILAISKAVAASDIAAHEDNSVKEPLIGENVALKGSKVKTTIENETLGTTEWILANGIRIIVKPTKIKADEVLLQVYSDGGLSNLTDADYYTGNFLPSVVAMSGISKFPMTDLRKQLSGKTANVMLSVNDYDNGMRGNCSPKDLETMLQLLYLNFTQPRFDKNDFDTMLRQYRSYIENMLTNPDYIAEDAVMKTLYDNNMRRAILSLEMLEKIDFDRLQPVFEALYRNARNFRFTFIGNVELETLKPLVEKYIGSLPVSKNKKDIMGYVDDGVRTVKGEVVNDFKASMQQPKVSVTRIFTGEIPYTIENKVAMTFLTQALSSRYLISIREEKGGTYGVHVQGNIENKPFSTYTLNISFDTNEQMADELSEIVMAELKKIAEQGPLAEDIEKTREFLVKNWSNTLEMNNGLQTVLNNWYNNGLNYMTDYENTVKNLKYEDVQRLAQKILADGNMTYVVMRPEAAQAE